MGNPRPRLRLFLVFSNINLILKLANMNENPSNIWFRDSNSRPFVHESPPITTRPVPDPTYKDIFGKF